MNRCCIQEFNFPDGKARLFPLVWKEAPEQPDAEFDLHLNNGRLLEHFHEGNLTYRSPGIKEKLRTRSSRSRRSWPRSAVFRSGSLVQLTSRRGRLRVRAVVTDRVTTESSICP